MGCHKISAGCQNCRIRDWIHPQGLEPFQGPIRAKEWSRPWIWNRFATECGCPFRINTCSLSDFFHPGADLWRDEAWKIIQKCNSLDWLIETKRPELIRERLPKNWGAGFTNVWLGTTIEDQSHIERLDVLSKIPAAIRFASATPLLGQVLFGGRIRHLNWVITGCEFAAIRIRRPMADNWVRSIRDECDAAGVPLFHKQHYDGGRLMFNGQIDGIVRRSFPETLGEAAKNASRVDI